MDALTFSFFTDFSHDPESKQYQLQHALTEVRRSFRKNALYPFLNQLIELRTQLNQLLAQLETFENNQPKKLIEIDLVRNELKYEPSFVDVNLQKTAMFIRQNLPLISSVIDEGAAIYDFVEQQVTMDPVGVVPTYQSEGYFLIPDHDADEVKIYRFELSHLTSATERFRGLKTVFIKALQDEEKLVPPNTVKLELIREHSDLPNPATYSFQSEMEFPFAQTVFPVCKRLLLRKVS